MCPHIDIYIDPDDKILGEAVRRRLEGIRVKITSRSWRRANLEHWSPARAPRPPGHSPRGASRYHRTNTSSSSASEPLALLS